MGLGGGFVRGVRKEGKGGRIKRGNAVWGKRLFQADPETKDPVGFLKGF